MPPTRRSETLRLTEFRLELPLLAQAALHPGVSEIWRIVIHYSTGDHPDQAADLAIGLSTQPSAALSISYRRTAERPTILSLTIPAARARAFAGGLRALGFDRLEDMPAIPWRDADLWLIGRGAGTFSRDLVLAPATATGIYARIVSVVQVHLHEAIRPGSG